MSDVHRARAVIEPPALAALAVTVTPAMIAELKAKLEATNALIGDASAYSEAVEMIRERIVEMTGAVTLSLVMRLLREVIAHATKPEHSYFHRWTVDDMVLWDNWRMMHQACGVPPEEERKMRRTTIAGDYALGRFED